MIMILDENKNNARALVAKRFCFLLKEERCNLWQFLAVIYMVTVVLLNGVKTKNVQKQKGNRGQNMLAPSTKVPWASFFFFAN